MTIKNWKINALSNTVAGAVNSGVGIIISSFVVHSLGKKEAWLWFAIWQVFSTCQTFSASMASPLIKYFSVIDDLRSHLIKLDKYSIVVLRSISSVFMIVFTIIMMIVLNKREVDIAGMHDYTYLNYAIVGALISSLIMSASQVPQAIFSSRHINIHGAVNVILVRGITFGCILVSIVITDSVYVSVAFSPVFSIVGYFLSKIYNNKYIKFEKSTFYYKEISTELWKNYMSSVLMSFSIVLLTAGMFQYLSYKNSSISASFGFANVYGVAILALAQAIIQPMLALVLNFSRSGNIKDAFDISSRARGVLIKFCLLIFLVMSLIVFIAIYLRGLYAISNIDLITVLLVVSAHLIRITSLPDSIIQIAFCRPSIQIASAATESTIAIVGVMLFGSYFDGRGVCVVALLSSVIGIIIHFLIRRSISHEV